MRRRATSRSEPEEMLAVFSPFMIALALALRMTKVTADVRAANKVNAADVYSPSADSGHLGSSSEFWSRSDAPGVAGRSSVSAGCGGDGEQFWSFGGEWGGLYRNALPE